MTLPAVKADIKNLRDDVNDHEARLRFLEKGHWWERGVYVGAGALLMLLIPKITEVLGLG